MLYNALSSPICESVSINSYSCISGRLPIKILLNPSSTLLLTCRILTFLVSSFGTYLGTSLLFIKNALLPYTYNETRYIKDAIKLKTIKRLLPGPELQHDTILLLDIFRLDDLLFITKSIQG